MSKGPPISERIGGWLYTHRIGDRGWDLLLFSIVWIVVGWSITLGDPDPEHMIPIEYLGTKFRVGLWYGCALIATIVAFRRNGGSRERGDSFGFAVLMIPPALRAISYWVAWAQGLLGLGGHIALWPEAVVWSVICIIVYRLARRPEMPRRPGGGAYGHHPGGAYGHPGLGRKRGEG